MKGVLLVKNPTTKLEQLWKTFQLNNDSTRLLVYLMYDVTASSMKLSLLFNTGRVFMELNTVDYILKSVF